MLEKYGFIERAEPRGREKPWRLVGSGSYATGVDPEVPGSLQATVELGKLTFAQRAQGLWAAMERLDREPQAWMEATRLMNASVWATAEEARALAAEISDVLDRYTGRDDPAERPAGARRVRVVTAVYSDPPEQAWPPRLPPARPTPASRTISPHADARRGHAHHGPRSPPSGREL